MSDINNHFNKILIYRALNFQQFNILSQQRDEKRQKKCLKMHF